MASTSKRMRVEEERSEEESTTVYDGDSDPVVTRVNWITFSQLKAIFQGKREETFTYEATQCTRKRTHVLELRENMTSVRS